MSGSSYAKYLEPQEDTNVWCDVCDERKSNCECYAHEYYMKFMSLPEWCDYLKSINDLQDYNALNNRNLKNEHELINKYIEDGIIYKYRGYTFDNPSGEPTIKPDDDEDEENDYEND